MNFVNKSYFPDKTKIQLASWGSESEIRILKPILKDFERENPDIEIDFMHIPQNYFQKLHLLFASNTAPDVIFINNHYLPIYANANVLEDLTPYSQEFEFEGLYNKSLEALTWDKKIYAVPRDVSTLVVFYNKDLFNKFKVPYPNENWSIEEFLDTAGKLTHLPEIFGISFDEEPLFYLPYLTYFGVKDFADMDSENYQKGLNFYSDLRNKYHYAPKKEEFASATMAQMFLQGRLGMQISGRWLVPKFREEAKFDWDVVSFPKGVVPLDSSGWAIAKSSKHKKESIRLIQYLASDSSAEKFAQSGLIVPARIQASKSKYFLDDQKPSNAKIFISIINSAVPTSVTVNFREVLDDLKTKTERIFNK
ncbi:sugar ABC transporter substrate-binding protein [bacterium]|nr:sugar ABC transporter substrate-binding protein [bacterium]